MAVESMVARLDAYLTTTVTGPRARGRYDPVSRNLKTLGALNLVGWIVAIPLLMVALVTPLVAFHGWPEQLPRVFGSDTVQLGVPGDRRAPARPGGGATAGVSPFAPILGGGVAAGGVAPVPGVASARLVPAVSDRSTTSPGGSSPAPGTNTGTPLPTAAQPLTFPALPGPAPVPPTPVASDTGGPVGAGQSSGDGVRSGGRQGVSATSTGGDERRRGNGDAASPRHDGRSRDSGSSGVQPAAESAPSPSGDGRWIRGRSPRHDGGARGGRSDHGDGRGSARGGGPRPEAPRGPQAPAPQGNPPTGGRPGNGGGWSGRGHGHR
jgi:hypothetical protein